MLISVVPKYNQDGTFAKEKRESIPLFMIALQRRKEKRGIERKSRNKKRKFLKDEIMKIIIILITVNI